MPKSYKELWNEQHERIYQTLRNAGCGDELAREIADEHAGELVLKAAMQKAKRWRALHDYYGE